MATLETDWAAAQAALITWVENSTGRNANWRDDRQFVGDPNPHFLLHVMAIEEAGRTQITYEYDSDQDLMVPKVSNLLRVTLEVSCRANINVAGSSSQFELTKLKLRGFMPSRLEALRTAGLGLSNSTPIVTVNFEHVGRVLSQSTAEFTFHFVDTYQDTSVTEGYIETTEGPAATADSDQDVVVGVNSEG